MRVILQEFVAIAGSEALRNGESDPEKRIYPGGAFDPLGFTKKVKHPDPARVGPWLDNAAWPASLPRHIDQTGVDFAALPSWQAGVTVFIGHGCNMAQLTCGAVDYDFVLHILYAIHLGCAILLDCKCCMSRESSILN